jgi:hypothetical protein
MAGEDDRVTLNPHSNLTHSERASVADNEALRIAMRKAGQTPAFGVTDTQQHSFDGSHYASNPDAMRQTIAARIATGDPSVAPTPQQRAWVEQFLLKRR